MVAAVSATLLTALLVPQDPVPPAGAPRALLRSADPAVRAWGAHRAAERGDEELTPDLLRAWIQLRSGETDQHRLSRRHIVAALVALRADVPPTELARLGREFPDAAIVLASRDPESYAAALLELLGQPLHSDAWTACVELLLPLENPALTSRLIRGLPTRLIVKVFDPGADLWVEASSSEGQRQERIDQPANFPPLVETVLTRHENGTTPVVDGTVKIYRDKITVPPGAHHDVKRVYRDAVADRLQRYRYLRHMLVEDAPNFVEHSGHMVIWTDAAAFQKTVDGLHSARASGWSDAVADLVASKLLDEKVAATLSPEIRIEVRDTRAKQSPPLPPVPAPTGAQVRIGRIYWQTDYDAALALARAQNKPLLLHFGENPG